MDRKLIIGQKYKHFKNMVVQIDMLAKDSETLEDMVVYHHIDSNEYWIRSVSMFLSEVDHNKYPNIKQKYRFELIEEE